MARLKVGIIGGGGISGAHLPHLYRHPAVELVALADLNPNARATAQIYDIPHYFSDYRELLPLVDAVLICIPTFLHAEIAIAALEMGKAVFCEKPLARTMEQALAIEDAVTRSGSPFQVGFVRRFDDEWLAWREAILQDKVGRPVIWHDMASSAAPGPAWFMRDEQGGGPFLDACIHNLDFALYTFGPVKSVFCHGRTLSPAATAIDTGTANIRFQSGDELMLAWSWGLPRGAAAARVFEILGPKGSVTWPQGIDPGPGYLLVHQGTNSEEITFAPDSLIQAFARQIDEFVLVAQGIRKPQVGIDEGIEALRLALSIIDVMKAPIPIRKLES